MVTNLLDAGAGTLRQAVIDANGAAGTDTIKFGPGGLGVITLASQIDITESVTIKGPGATKTIVSGDDATRIFNIDDGNPLVAQTVKISGLSLVHGSDTTGGAIASAESLVLRKMKFGANSSTGSGGAVAFSNSVDGAAPALVVKSSVFTGNHSDTNGGALYSQTIAGVKISKTLFAHNDAGNGGGGAFLQINGGGMGKIVLSKETFRGNAGGGAHLDNTGSGVITVSESLFIGNKASGAGGGLFVANGRVTLTNDTFQENRAGFGGGFANAGATTETIIIGGKFLGNYTSEDGGGLLMQGGTNSISKTV